MWVHPYVRRSASVHFDSPFDSCRETKPLPVKAEISSSTLLASRLQPHLPTVTGKRHQATVAVETLIDDPPGNFTICRIRSPNQHFWNLLYNMQRPDPPLRSGGQYRQLRAITILMLPVGLALILPYAIVTGSIFPAVGIAPLVFSGVLGSLIYHNVLRSSSVNASIDVSLSVVYFSFLVPR